ncbi:MAG: endolytic transglycosylase MltG [Alphaproteobacteria bacterium]
MFIFISYLDKPGPLNAEKTIVLPKGFSLNQISHKLYKENVIDYPKLFLIAAKLLSLKYNFKAGEYKFTPKISSKTIFSILIDGKSVIHKLTIVEGLTTTQIVNLINSEARLLGEITVNLKEGELLPETYFFSYGDSKQTLINRMQIKLQETINELWPKRAPNLPISTVAEAITLASIVEKETSLSSERPRIAAVFMNRLKKGMKLQADPTTIYAITLGKVDFNRSLTKKDLGLKSEFNTYFTNALPPYPICNPGKASIAAVLNPDQTDELFFVVDGSGGHKFSNNYSQHHKNVIEYRKKNLAK